MNMLNMTAMNVIVAFALLLAVAFTVAWALSPRLRAWIEKPNYRFRSDAETYDERIRKSL